MSSPRDDDTRSIAHPPSVITRDLAQHGPASQLGEPYVYLYHYQDTEGMFNQIRKAAQTPIER